MTKKKDMLDDMKLIYAYPEALTNAVTHYCPGCVHGITKWLKSNGNKSRRCILDRIQRTVRV